VTDRAPNRRLAVAAYLLVAVTWCLVVLGSAVRANGAGLACPDWPLCFGDVIPQIDFHVAYEFGHRVLAGGVSIGFLVVAVGTLRSARALWPWVAAAAVALAVQIVLGGLTVLELLAEWTVTSHLLTGNTFAVLLFLLASALWERGAPASRSAVGLAPRLLHFALASALLFQLALGGLVASSHAGLACGTWPGCNGPVWFPTFEGLVGLQLLHRLGAYTVVAFAVVNLVANGLAGRRGLAALLVASVAIAQMLLGVANVLLRMPVEVTVLHSAGAATLVLATAFLGREVWGAPVPAARRSVALERPGEVLT
jgi:cytochrome c oxidase assembly protein subunit 15